MCTSARRPLALFSDVNEEVLAFRKRQCDSGGRSRYSSCALTINQPGFFFFFFFFGRDLLNASGKFNGAPTRRQSFVVSVILCHRENTFGSERDNYRLLGKRSQAEQNLV